MKRDDDPANEATRDPSALIDAEEIDTDLSETVDPAPRVQRTVRDAEIGDRIGPYRIRRLIARGGMGAVYLAEREDHFKQRVALKTIRPDRSGDAILDRFYAERQVLAELEHPTIARIFDGGAAADTLPYFVMEYVKGERFDIACRKLSLRERLELFREVCEGVQYAHQNLVVHRDLKPGNILVAADGRPKLLDFGIAKILSPEEEPDPDSVSRAEEAETDHGPLTLAYASPEQLSGGRITAAVDVYSLGVLLYEVLCGRHPYPPREMSRKDLFLAVVRDEPSPPSVHAPPETARKLAGDLDAIVLKAMRKKPEERYGSVAEFSEEIRRHLEDLPVAAHRGSWTHRVRKSVRRHRTALAAAVLLVGSTLTVTALWVQAEAQRARAEQALTQSERTRGFILDFFKSVEPDRNPGSEVDLRKILESGRLQLEASLHEEPEVRADLLGTIGAVYNALALYDEALELQEEAVRIRRDADPSPRRALAVDLNNLGSSYYARGQYAEAEAAFREALPIWRMLGDAYEPNAAANLAGTLIRRSDGEEEALELYGRALELSPDDAPSTAAIRYGLGAVYRRKDDPRAAEPHLREALAIYERHPETEASRIAQVRSSLGKTLRSSGRFQEARVHLEEALQIRRRVFGEGHRSTVGSEKNLALLLTDLGELSAARMLLEKASDGYQLLGDDAQVEQIRQALRRVEEDLATEGESVVDGSATDSSNLSN